MPMYEYTCTKCQRDFELLRELSQRDEKCQCPHCQAKGKMPRKSSLFSSAGNSGAATSSSCGPSSSGFG